MCVMCVCVGVVVKMLSGVEGCLKALVVSVAGAPSTIHCSLHHTSFFYRILNFLLRYLLEVKYLRGRTINIFIFFMFQTVFLLFFCFLAFLLIRKRECARYALPLS